MRLTKTLKNIADSKELYSAYIELESHSKDLKNEAESVINPIKKELRGTTKKQGQIEKIRKELALSRLSGTILGFTVITALRNIEDIDNWQSWYILHLEKIIDNFKFIARSSLNIVKHKTSLDYKLIISLWIIFLLFGISVTSTLFIYLKYVY